MKFKIPIENMPRFYYYTFLCFISSVLGCINSSADLNWLKEKHFSRSEILFLSKLEENFKKSICSTNFNKNCLNEYLESHRDSLNNNNPINSRLNPHEIEMLLEDTIDQNIFEKHCSIRSNDDTENQSYFCINPEGNYINYLKELAESNEAIDAYVNRLEYVGDITPTMFVDVINRYEKYEFTKNENFILLVIHFVHLELAWNAEEQIKEK